MKKKYCSIFKLILIVFFIILTLNSYSENLNKYTFIISDFSNTNANKWSIRNALEYEWSGLSISLNYNKEGDNLLLTPVENKVAFSKFAEYVLDVVRRNPDKLIPIFINYTGPIGALKESFVKSGLSKKLFFLPSGERWPGVQDILASKKNLVVFTFQKTKPSNTLFHYAWDYIAEYPNSGIEDPMFEGYYPNGDITKELLLIRDLEIPRTRGHREFTLDVNQNQYYINHLLNRWKHTGKRANFIFSEKSTRFMLPIFPWLNTYKSVTGVVKIGEKPLEKVYWQHSNRCISNGYFNFPYLEGEELNLTPYCPGYSFNPKSITINNEHFITPLSFSAKPLTLNEGLTGYFSFDNSWTNYANKNEKITPINSSFTNDVTRGEVAKISEGAFIEIGIPAKYGMRGNSFTVSSWIKLNEIDSTTDQSILGTPEGMYRKGLHLVIREQRPYFGFFGNDLWAEKIVVPQEWHHIVFRYNNFNGEQAIYFDGKSVGSSFNHSSFIGDSTLQIGRSLRSNTFFDGYMDDMYIWSRALGEEEIQILFSSGFEPDFNQNRLLPYIWGSLVLIVFLILVIIIGYALRKRKKRNQVLGSHLPDKGYLFKNALFLFGEFQLYDSNGNELSGYFTPKIKELFLLLLISSVKNKNGIKTDRLTSILWPGFSPGKAANNRSVTFNKLRKIIEPVNGLSIIFNNGYWKTQFDDILFFDYMRAFSFVNGKNNPSKYDLEHFFQIIKKGVFLSEIHWEWLDEIRGFVANEIIDTLLRYSELLNSKEDSQLLKLIAERILAIDDLHEQAQRMLINLLIIDNNRNLAKYQFNLFKNNYLKAYGEEYKFGFDEFIALKD